MAAPSLISTSITSSAVTNYSNTQSHTVVAGTNRVLYVYLALSQPSAGVACTYGGVSMTQISVNISGYLFRLVNPPVGTANIAATWSDLIARSYILGACFKNVNLVNPDTSTTTASFVRTGGNSRTNPGLTVSSRTGDTVVDFVHATRPITAQLLTVGAGQTQINNNGLNATPDFCIASSYAIGETSATMGWTCNTDEPGATWYQVGISIRPDSQSQFFYWF